MYDVRLAAGLEYTQTIVGFPEANFLRLVGSSSFDSDNTYEQVKFDNHVLEEGSEQEVEHLFVEDVNETCIQKYLYPINSSSHGDGKISIGKSKLTPLRKVQW